MDAGKNSGSEIKKSPCLCDSVMKKLHHRVMGFLNLNYFFNEYYKQNNISL